MEDLAFRPAKSLSELRKKCLPAIRNSLNTRFTEDFQALIAMDEEVLVPQIALALHELFNLDLQEVETLLFTHGPALSIGIAEAKEVVCVEFLPPDQPAPSVAHYMTSQAMLVQTIMAILHGQVAINEGNNGNDPEPPPPPPPATPSFHISVPTPPTDKPKTARSRLHELENGPIKIDPKKIDEDHKELQRVIAELARARALNQTITVNYKLWYDYERPENTWISVWSEPGPSMAARSTSTPSKKTPPYYTNSKP